MADEMTVLTCVISKEEGETSYGFGLGQPLGTPHTVIKTLKPGGAGSRAGLAQGDFILSINNKSLLGLNIKGVSDIIKQAPDGVLHVGYSRVESEDADKENRESGLLGTMPASTLYPQAQSLGHEEEPRISVTQQPDPIFVHHLQKWPSCPGFGFSIQQRQDGTKAVVSIQPNTPAFASGVRQGSIVCQINSQSVLAKTYQETVALVKASGPEVALTITTPETLQWLAGLQATLDDSMDNLHVVRHEAPPQPPTEEPQAPEPTPPSARPTLVTTANRMSDQPDSAEEPEKSEGKDDSPRSSARDDSPRSSAHESSPRTSAQEDSPRTSAQEEQEVQDSLVLTQSTMADSNAGEGLYSSITPVAVAVQAVEPSEYVTVEDIAPTSEDDSTTTYRCIVSKSPDVRGYGFRLKHILGQNGLPGYLNLINVDDGSPAFESGLETGMVLVTINGEVVFNKNVADVKPLVAARKNEVEFTVITHDDFLVALGKFGEDLSTAAQNFKIVDRERKSVEDRATKDFGGTLSLTAKDTDMPEQRSLPVWPSNIPVPRSCQLSKWPDKFKGYGFHLQAERNKPAHFLGKMDPESPAEHGGLVESWRIVAVNDENILNEPHATVVSKIRLSGDAVCLLIASSEAVAFCEQNNIVISKSMAECQVQSYQTPLNPPESVLPQSPATPEQVVAPTIKPAEQATPTRPSVQSDSLESPAPPTPPSPLPISPDQNKQPDYQGGDDDDLAYMRALRSTLGTRRLKDARRQPGRDVKAIFETANNM